ncbi:MAG: 2,3,4,5-tetrahydropyridine-2,6-dicarboxylate N-succinyltransferase [Actinomycetota bacterium]|nr:MAG: 2,3,4,5-tetrahydropyridine-2,6-dicarboxylate N-succinyltransferase [Actinomycetota bacterium]
MTDLEARIEKLWFRRAEVDPSDVESRMLVHEAINLLDSGEARVAEIDPASDQVVVHEWLKHAILMLFRFSDMKTMDLAPFEFVDRIPLKADFASHGVRVVPGASARWGSFLEAGVTLMPSYVNIGARVGSGTMVDTWATVGSCAQIGKRVHLSGGVGIGGVLEPVQASPVVIEDEAFIGSRAMITEGARVGEGAVVAAGVILNPSIPVIDSETGEEIFRGRIPPWSVAISATRPRKFAGGEFGLPCVLVIKHLSEGERHDKAGLNDLLRDHGVAT